MRFRRTALQLKREIQMLTMHKHKTACDACGSVRSLFDKRHIFDIYQTEREAVQCLCEPLSVTFLCDNIVKSTSL